MKYTSISLIALIAACSPNYLTAPAPVVPFDEFEDPYQPAIAMPEPMQTRVVTVPSVMPMPGQLKPPPKLRTTSKAPPADAADPQARVDTANRAARVEPTYTGWVNAVQVYEYDAGALYQVYCQVGQLTSVTLQEGEQLITTAAGDTDRWIIGDTTTGKDAHARVQILIKPRKPNISTNVIISTDRRTYHIELHTQENTYMAAVSWNYPTDQLIAVSREAAKSNSVANTTVDSGVKLDELKFRYRITGDPAPWKPARVFDDTRKVYIEFPRRLDQGDAPPLFVVSTKGEPQLVNYRQRGNYYVVDRLFGAAELRLGTDPQMVVRIERTDVFAEAPQGQ